MSGEWDTVIAVTVVVWVLLLAEHFRSRWERQDGE